MAETTTTTSTTPTTTTTTSTVTPIPPLSVVKTSLFKKVNGVFKEIFYTDASDNDETKNQLFAQSLDFGNLAPGETSETLAIALNIPYCKAIANIQLSITSTGGITFTSSTFGITSSSELRSDIVPETYFSGTNIVVDIPNRDNFHSNYVYLNVKLPLDQSLGYGLINYTWSFKYAS